MKSERKSGKTRHGNTWLNGARGAATLAAWQAKDTYLAARCRRLRPRMATRKTIVAIQHSVVVAAWHMLTLRIGYQDIGSDYFTHLDPNAPCDASCGKPTGSASPSVSTRSAPADLGTPPA
ncbi:hypothetical protein [Streptomyces sp. NPDC020362]|uniref:hypothetical protein n=1 Tax=Streptomyces sp. NPDC020362 TaxID=3154486 RepID=UPI0033D2B93C